MRKMFSEKQIKKIAETGDTNFSGDVDVNGDVSVDGDVSITGDVNVKTIEQTNYNYDSGVIELNPTWLNGITATSSFLKFVVINKVFYIIVSLTLLL